MEIIEKLLWLKLVHGTYDEARLRELATQHGVPLYRIQELLSFYPHLRPRPLELRTLRVCCDLACCLQGAEQLRRALAAALREAGVDDMVLEAAPCLGRCEHAPAALLDDEPVRVAPGTRQPVLEPILVDEPDGTVPEWRMYPYRSRDDAFGTAARLVAAEPAERQREVLQALEAAGLRGMGGAGFPTHRKWRTVAEAEATPKYVICNADESEPGTFKDRMILSTMPELVLEGMLLAALVTGATQGYLFLRHEYAPEGSIVEVALERARSRGHLGPNALGPGRSFDVDLVTSPGGYILGEETALLEVLEGRRGEPRLRPPYPAESGLFGKPTLINNVETFAAAAAIVAKGAAWWQQFGRHGSRGLKFVSVSGRVRRPGVYEIELGTTVQEVIELAGGTVDGRQVKAFTPGGVSARWLGPEHLETPLDFEPVAAAGSTLGTAALIVLTEGDSVCDVARTITSFFAAESCGKCVPCRLGTAAAVRLLKAALDDPTGAPLQLATLRELAELLQATSICGLGQVALNGLLSLAERFPAEFPLREQEA